MEQEFNSPWKHSIRIGFAGFENGRSFRGLYRGTHSWNMAPFLLNLERKLELPRAFQKIKMGGK